MMTFPHIVFYSSFPHYSVHCAIKIQIVCTSSNVNWGKFVSLKSRNNGCYFPKNALIWFHQNGLEAFFSVHLLKIVFYFMLKSKTINFRLICFKQISRWILLKRVFFHFVLWTCRFRTNSIGNMFRITSSIVFCRSHICIQISYRRYYAFRSEQSWIFWKERWINDFTKFLKLLSCLPIFQPLAGTFEL